MNKQNMPLKSLADGRQWVEKTINEVEKDSTSIARGNARIGAVKAFTGLYRLAMDYAKLTLRGAKVRELEGLVKVELLPHPES